MQDCRASFLAVLSHLSANPILALLTFDPPNDGISGDYLLYRFHPIDEVNICGGG